ncbi:DUF2630 domain-containing protein [Streptacidiphilus pinicola]|uniref:DUF2630 domain-containing protein n=1 Tax=Streptacidiphilus pinicola TaxID=2219663 RepID=A0A2X0ILI0_9ACTN|nr:DUF2630 family protein [Streptacidiphilus pinicola]RAG85972.1 DUF2630 domain-containing protein [Streptacidiphilus pinicola]
MTQQDRSGDDSVLARIHELVGEERELRDQLAAQKIDADTERGRLTALETQLDQCWDLLRQRRARLDAGQDPNDARVRPASEVENYLS